MATEFVTEPLDNSPNPYRLSEPRERAGAYLVWEVNPDFCRKILRIDNSLGVAPIMPGTVLIDKVTKKFVGVLFGRPVHAGAVDDRTISYRGSAIYRGEKLVFPKVTDAPDGADPGSDNAAENAAATITLEAALRAEMAALDIDIQ